MFVCVDYWTGWLVALTCLKLNCLRRGTARNQDPGGWEGEGHYIPEGGRGRGTTYRRGGGGGALHTGGWEGGGALHTGGWEGHYIPEGGRGRGTTYRRVGGGGRGAPHTGGWEGEGHHIHYHHQNGSYIKMGSEERRFQCFIDCEGQSHKTVSTKHNLFEENGEPKRYRTEVLLLSSLSSLTAGPELLTTTGLIVGHII